MKIEQIIELIYQLSDEYISTNYSNDTNDMAYNLGAKRAIEGFRRYMLYYLTHFQGEGTNNT